jgi:hypothetical protein
MLGLAAALIGLVETLDKNGVMRLEDYRATPHRYWNEMPEDEAGGGAGFLLNG